MSSGSGFFQHGHTYLGHAVACAAALAVQQVIERDGLLARVREGGARLEGLLKETLGSHPNVGDIRGRGLFWGIELVRDRADQGAVRSGAATARPHQEGSVRPGLDGLPDGRHRGWPLW